MNKDNNIIYQIKEYIPNEKIKLNRNKETGNIQIIFVE
jgi:hypothetical protein